MIRQATYEDIPRLMEIFSKAREIMRTSGNLHQWNDKYPSEDIVKRDVQAGHCVVLCEAGRILACMSLIPGPDPTYAHIYPGVENAKCGWLNDEPYHVIHRIAAAEPGHNAAVRLLDWAFARKATSIRIDTHRDNIIMHHILKRYGFSPCGIIYLANGDPRDAYHMEKK